MEFAKQYEVWEAKGGKPHRVKCEAAIGMKRVRIDGVWIDRSEEGGIFNTQAACQEWIDRTRGEAVSKSPADPMFIPVLSEGGKTAAFNDPAMEVDHSAGCNHRYHNRR